MKDKKEYKKYVSKNVVLNKKTTITEAPEATSRLIRINPDKVSLVDYGANNSMGFVAKNAEVLNEDNSKYVIEMLSTTKLQLENMKESLEEMSIDNDVEFVPKNISNQMEIHKKLFETGVLISLSFDEENISEDIKEKIILISDSIISEIDKDIENINNGEEYNVSESFKKLSEKFDIIDNYKEKSLPEESKDREVEMSFVKKIEKAKEEDSSQPEIDSLNFIQKAISANSKLSEVLSSFNIDSDEAKEMDYWDLRWKVGEMIDLLVDAAKLEDILGSDTTDKNVDDLEISEDPSEDPVEDPSEVPSEELSEDPSETPSEVPSEELSEDPVEISSDTFDQKAFMNSLKDTITGIVEPMQKSFKDLETRLEKRMDKTDKNVKSIMKLRSPSKGSPNDNPKPVKKVGPLHNVLPDPLKSKN